MQRLINVLALSSFLISAAVVGGGVYLFTNKDALIEKTKEQIMGSVTDALPGALTGSLGGSLVQSPADSIPNPAGALIKPAGKPSLPFSSPF